MVDPGRQDDQHSPRSCEQQQRERTVPLNDRAHYVACEAPRVVERGALNLVPFIIYTIGHGNSDVLNTCFPWQIDHGAHLKPKIRSLEIPEKCWEEVSIPGMSSQVGPIFRITP